MTSYPIRRVWWAVPFLLPLSPDRPFAEVGGGEVRVRMGLHGRADVPVARIDRVGTFDWPFWGGVGARITKGMVAFVGAPGSMVVLELAEPMKVRAPLSWTTARIGVGVEDPDAFMAEVAAARR
ncbi:hypothetical protein [Miltoncostaea oceani]|uniref:hypothetical protein n=1 Tax=Miltoncostaea oceani TaxID=2843216 RepID=UPI001C3E5591|nr:hypothetical protein [Miltoncostaea oceani]